MRVPLAPLASCASLLLVLACSAGGREGGDDEAGEGRPTTAATAPAAPGPTGTPSSATPRPTPTLTPAPTFDAGRAVRDVRALAGDIGPRLATGPGYRRAATYVEQRLRSLGYEVTRQVFDVPAGDSWGTPVEAGRSSNVVAVPPGFTPDRPHRIVGAHLDTVAVSPGAEDNASGVAVLLEVARLAAAGGTRLPTVLVAFGAEEPRGPTDADHHYGSQHYVRTMGTRERATLRAMVALDRVGVGSRVPVCTGPISPHRVRDDLLRLAGREGIPAHSCELTTSDHWSFEKAGHTVARLGSTPFDGYHSPRDLPRVVSQAQLDRTGRLVWAWLR